MRVLFVGATGIVGRNVTPILAQDFDMRLAAHESGEIAGLPVKAVDIRDFEGTLALVKESGAEAVVNCAIADYRSKPTSGTPELAHQYNQSTIEVNVRGAYHLYEAAARHGVSKFVFISSLTTVMERPEYETLKGQEMPRPLNFYACTKLFGEQLGMTYSATENMSVTCLRLGQPHLTNPDRVARWLANPATRSRMVHMEDIALAVRQALREQRPYTVYPVVSQCDPVWVQDSAMKELGYNPRYLFSAEGVRLRDEPAEP